MSAVLADEFGTDFLNSAVSMLRELFVSGFLVNFGILKLPRGMKKIKKLNCWYDKPPTKAIGLCKKSGNAI